MCSSYYLQKYDILYATKMVRHFGGNRKSSIEVSVCTKQKQAYSTHKGFGTNLQLSSWNMILRNGEKKGKGLFYQTVINGDKSFDACRVIYKLYIQN